jgi:hypothetical protein
MPETCIPGQPICVTGACTSLQVGLRIQLWTNAPLSKPTSDTPGVASGPVAAASAVPVAPNTSSTPPVGEAVEQGISAIPPGSTVVPAVEVGIMNQQLIFVGDPSLEDQWLEARVQEQLGIAVPKLRCNASSVPLEAMLLVCSCPLPGRFVAQHKCAFPVLPLNSSAQD